MQPSQRHEAKMGFAPRRVTKKKTVLVGPVSRVPVGASATSGCLTSLVGRRSFVQAYAMAAAVTNFPRPSASSTAAGKLRWGGTAGDFCEWRNCNAFVLPVLTCDPNRVAGECL